MVKIKAKLLGRYHYTVASFFQLVCMVMFFIGEKRYGKKPEDLSKFQKTCALFLVKILQDTAGDAKSHLAQACLYKFDIDIDPESEFGKELKGKETRYNLYHYLMDTVPADGLAGMYRSNKITIVDDMGE